MVSIFFIKKIILPRTVYNEIINIGHKPNAFQANHQSFNLFLF